MIENLKLPKGFNPKLWITRWDKMQERYLVERNKRFEIISNLIRHTQRSNLTIIDLGCGTGSLTLKLLEDFPKSSLIGIDVDLTLLILAKYRTKKFKHRTTLLLEDLRNKNWIKKIPNNIDAVVSATTLHWFSENQLKKLYKQIHLIIKKRGIFLNADHVGSDNILIQKSWVNNRDKILKMTKPVYADDWQKFFDDYLDELGNDAREIRNKALGKWEGIEEGMPLSWHFDKLRECGFSSVDCFWRSDCDAICGGIK